MADKKREKYEALHGIDEARLRQLYLVEGKGLRGVERELGIPYRVLRYLANSYGIMRTAAESIKLNNKSLPALFLAKYGVDNPSKLEVVKAKIQDNRDVGSWRASCEATNLRRYGVKNVFQTPAVKAQIKAFRSDPAVAAEISRKLKEANLDPVKLRARLDKTRKTLQARYGVDNPFQIPELQALTHSPEAQLRRRLTHEQAGRWVPEDLREEFLEFHKRVRRGCRGMREALLINSDGKCCYTGDILVTAKEFRARNPGESPFKNRMMPVVDHRVSILVGFLKGWSVERMNELSNLCVCSYESNIIKNWRAPEDFKNSEYVKNKKHNTFKERR